MHSASGDVAGPWTQHLAYELGRDFNGDDAPDDSPQAGAYTDYNADADTSADPYRWDCQMADPTFLELADGSALIAYRGTQCWWEDSRDAFVRPTPATRNRNRTAGERG